MRYLLTSSFPRDGDIIALVDNFWIVAFFTIMLIHFMQRWQIILKAYNLTTVYFTSCYKLNSWTFAIEYRNLDFSNSYSKSFLHLIVLIVWYLYNFLRIFENFDIIECDEFLMNVFMVYTAMCQGSSLVFYMILISQFSSYIESYSKSVINLLLN